MRKLMWFTVGFGGAALLSGYLLSRQLYLPAAVISCLLLTVSLLMLMRWRAARIPVAVFLGAVLGFCWQFVFDCLYLSPIREVDEQSAEISVLIVSPCEEAKYGFVTEGILILEEKPYRVRIYLDEETEAQLGDTLSGRFHLYSMLADGSRDISYNRGNGVYLMASGGKEVKVQSPQSLPLLCWPAYMKLQVLNLMDRIFPEDVLGFVRALLLGDTAHIDYETDTALKISGIRHVIAVSGLHVTILFGLIFMLAGRRRLLTALLGFPVLFFFAAVVGFSPSVTRACLMNGIMVLASLFDREYDGPTALSFAVLVMLTVNPIVAINVSFQLSVGCMTGIFLFAEPIKNWLTEKKRLGRFRWKKFTNWFASSVGISIGAAVITTPLSAFYFGTVSLVSIATNLLTLWIITFLFYGIMLACALSVLWIPLGTGIAWALSWGVRYVLGTAKLLAAFPLAAVYTSSTYIVFWLIFCYGMLAVYLLLKKKFPFLYGSCAAIGLCVALLFSWVEPVSDECRVTVLDVGQGQCILLQSGGRSFLVDCGGDSDESAANSAAQLLLSQGISRLDGLILTHFDEDHAGGAQYLLSRVPADRLLMPECLDEGEIFQELTSYTAGQTSVIQQITFLRFADASITLIPSQMGFVDNESGLCILFQTENCDILITGDRSESGERELMQDYPLPELELLIVGHHGSKYSTSRELLELTKPKMAIISVGANNRFGHPSERVINLLEEFGCTYYRTDRNGTVVYRR